VIPHQIVVLFAILVGSIIGVIAHESSHFLVLRLTRREVRLRINRQGRTVYPSVQFPRPAGSVPWDVRVAAIAPLAVAIVVGIPAIGVAALTDRATLAMALGAFVWTGKLSKQDRKLARGQLS
jgi:hypothetical protein